MRNRFLQLFSSKTKPSSININVDTTSLTYKSNAGEFNSLPDDILKIILSCCDLATLHIIKNLNKRFYHNAKMTVQTKHQLLAAQQLNTFTANFSDYRTNFTFNFKDENEVSTHLNFLPQQIDKIFSAHSSIEDKRLNSLAIGLLLAEIIHFLTTNQILKMTITRRIEIKSFSNYQIYKTYRQRIKSFVTEQDIKDIKEKMLPYKNDLKGFNWAIEKIIQTLKDAAFDQSDIEVQNFSLFAFKLNAKQTQLLTAIRDAINKLENNLKQLNSLPAPEIKNNAI